MLQPVLRCVEDPCLPSFTCRSQNLYKGQVSLRPPPTCKMVPKCRVGSQAWHRARKLCSPDVRLTSQRTIVDSMPSGLTHPRGCEYGDTTKDLHRTILSLGSRSDYGAEADNPVKGSARR